jgi:branched-chain amino acid transport system ATP-binding protein
LAFLKESATSLLEVEGLHMNFGGIRALSDFSFKVDEGEILSVIGPNGAGKTTLINCISGIYRARKGTILFRGKDVTGRNPNQIAQLGMARTFQNIALFRGMTVLDNMLIGQGYLLHYGLLGAALFLGRALNEEVRGRDKVEEIIEFLDLQHVRKSPVGGLPYGMQKKVELGRALAMEPRLLLIDEPVSGMNLEETEDMARYILDINEELGITIILIEHDMGLVMDISHRITVLNFGLKIAEGAPKEIVKNPEVIKAYLGEVGDS